MESAYYQKIDVLRRLAVFHEDTRQFHDGIAAIVGLVRSNRISDARGEFASFCRRNIDEHFAFEEEIVLPAVEKAAVIDKLKAQILTAHETARSYRNKIEKQLSSFGKQDDAPLKELEENIVRMLAFLKAHAEKEDHTLVRIIGRNSKIRFAIGRGALDKQVAERDTFLPTRAAPTDGSPVDADEPLEASYGTLHARDENSVESDEGFVVELIDDGNVRYIEDGKTLTCPIMEEEKSGRAITAPENVIAWDPPHNWENTPEAIKVIIALRISESVNFLRRMKAGPASL